MRRGQTVASLGLSEIRQEVEMAEANPSFGMVILVLLLRLLLRVVS